MSEARDTSSWTYEIQGTLTDQERRALREREDHGIIPAPMRQFASLREFQAESNNFHAHFTSPIDSIAGPAYRSKKVYARFELMDPTLFYELTNRLEGTGPFFHKSDGGAWVPLFLAYDVMSRLVDVSDVDVMKNGRINPKYLCD
jgi:hypothetical protein